MMQVRPVPKVPETGSVGGLSSPAALIERHRCDVRRYMARRLCRKEDAEDLTQEVCLRFLALPPGSCPEKPLRYLFAIVRHALADFFKKRSREAAHVMAMPDDADYPADAEATAFRDPAETVITWQQLNAALIRLPATHRRALLEHEHDGYSYQEVAVRLGLSNQTVAKYLTMAKAQARASLIRMSAMPSRRGAPVQLTVSRVAACEPPADADKSVNCRAASRA